MSIRALEWLQTLGETDLYDVLQHLVSVLGYQSVALLHGPLEAGKDIVFAERDRVGRLIWRAIQVKAYSFGGSISGPKSLRSALIQCEAALDSPYRGANGHSIRIAEVWLVTPFPVGEHAKASSVGRLNSMERVHVIDGPALADLINENLPELVNSDTSPVKNYFEHLRAACDAPEEYLSARLRVRYSFQQVFVIPHASIAVPTLTALLQMPSLQTLASDRILLLDGYRRQGLLSGLDFRSLVSSLVSLRVAGEIASAISTIAPIGQALLTHLAHLSTAVSIPQTISMDSPELSTISLRAAARVTEEVLRGLQCDNAVLSGLPRHVADHFDPGGRLRPEPLPAIAGAYSGVREDAGAFPGLLEVLSPMVYAAYGTSTNMNAQEVRLKLSQVQDTLMLLDQTVRRVFGEANDQIDSNLLNDDFLDPDILGEPLANICNCSMIGDLLQSVGMKLEERRVRCDAMAVGGRIARVIFVGPLGIGKTTLLKQLCAAAITSYESSETPRMPVFCALAAAREQPGLQTEEIVLGASKVMLPGLNEYSPSAIDWVLDGFDEIESLALRGRILSWVTSGAARMPRCILGARQAALEVPVPGFPRLLIEAFSSTQVQEYVRRFPWADRDRAERLLEVLRLNPELASLAETPLILTLITLLCQHHDPELLPSRRDELYERISRLLMGDWDVAKGFQRRHLLDDFLQRMALVERTAFILYDKRKSNFTRRDFSQACLSAVPLAQFPPNVVEQLFEEIITDCLLTTASAEEYRFFHFSIHEYLAAKELARDITPVRLKRVLLEYFQSGGSWWEEVLVFYAGIKRDITALVSEMLFETLAGPAEQLAPLILRLLRRMLAAADLTRVEGIAIRGMSVQAALADLGVLER